MKINEHLELNMRVLTLTRLMYTALIRISFFKKDEHERHHGRNNITCGFHEI